MAVGEADPFSTKFISVIYYYKPDHLVKRSLRSKSVSLLLSAYYLHGQFFGFKSGNDTSTHLVWFNHITGTEHIGLTNIQ